MDPYRMSTNHKHCWKRAVLALLDRRPKIVDGSCRVLCQLLGGVAHTESARFRQQVRTTALS